MAPSSSSSSDDESKKQPTRSSDTTNHPHNPAPTTAIASATTTTTTINSTGGAPNPLIGHPPAMGYPPPHQPYHPNGHYPYNPYTQPPPPYHYANQHYAYLPNGTVGGVGAGGGSAFVRGFLAVIIILIIITCAVSIMTWLILRPEIPLFYVDKFSVSGLNLSSPQFYADWDASLTVENPNHKLKIYFNQMQGFVYYKENFLSSSPMDPMFLETRSRNTLAMKLATNNTEQHLVGNWVVEEIAKERSGGAVRFDVRMLVLATFKYGSWWTRHASMKVFCEKLKLDFVGGQNNTSGVLDGGGKPPECAVYYA